MYANAENKCICGETEDKVRVNVVVGTKQYYAEKDDVDGEISVNRFICRDRWDSARF